MSQNQSTTAQPGAQQQQTAVVKYENVADLVMKRVESFTADGSLVLPKSYSVGNNLKSAWLILQEAVDRNNKPVLEVCTRASIANAIFVNQQYQLRNEYKQAVGRFYEACLRRLGVNSADRKN